MRLERKRKILVKDLNPILTCTLCEGYLIDATVLTDCLHVFCRGCIIKYFDNCRTACPNCNIIYKKKNHQICFRPDPQLQSLVYKLVPNLYSREKQTREDFYRSTGVRASSSCSDDSVIDNERETKIKISNVDPFNDRDVKNDEDIGANGGNVAGDLLYFSQEDMISLSLEYYKEYLDTTSTNATKNETKNGNDTCEIKIGDENLNYPDVGKRFLKCPAAVTMQLLQKFLRMKFGLSADHRVDVIYKGEVMANYLTLMDVAYIFKWIRTKPMRFFYRIFTPLKIKPIKIVNVAPTSTSGNRNLQIIKSENDPRTQILIEENDQDQSYRKERLMAHLQLQSTHKKPANSNLNNNNNNVGNEEHRKERQQQNLHQNQNCVFEYMEPDKEEIKRFAEERDREWAKLNETNSEHYFKKRKKSKHSKSESVHKKRKLHAEICSNEKEDLKLKVKITPHKHKHHKNHDVSAKEKLLQMRQVRHKHNSSEDGKKVQQIPTTKQVIIDKLNEKLKTKEPNFVGNVKKKDDKSDKTVRFVEPSEKCDSNSAPPLLQLNKLENKSLQNPNNTFLKSFQSYTEKYNLEKNKQLRVEIKQNIAIDKMNNEKMKSVPPALKITSVAPPKLAAAPPKPSLAPPKPTVAPPKPIAAPTKPTAASPKPTAVPDKPTVAPPKPTVATPKPTGAPAKPTAAPAKPTAAPPKSSATTPTQIAPLKPINQSSAAQVKNVSPTPNKVTSAPMSNKAVTSPTSKAQPALSQSTVAPPLKVTTAPSPAPAALKSSIQQNFVRSPLVKSASIPQLRTQTSTPPIVKMKSLTPPIKLSNSPSPSSIVRTISSAPARILNHPPNFTVSKVENSSKRKHDEINCDVGNNANSNSGNLSKKPSLEITLIPQNNNCSNSNVSTNSNSTSVQKIVKRPPPSTIPLERIRKTINLKSGISIIPKQQQQQTIDSVDNVGALDLSNKSPENSPKSVAKTINGINMLITKTLMKSGEKQQQQQQQTTSHQLSNLQMLSKVATEHPILNKLANNSPNVVKNNVNNNNNGVVRKPNNVSSSPPGLLQSIKPNLPKLQKLTTQFKQIGSSNLIRNQTNNSNNNQQQQQRPNQNIRNIPNPSLLVRQQNQNRLNSISANIVVDKKENSSVNSVNSINSNNSNNSNNSKSSNNLNLVPVPISNSNSSSVNVASSASNSVVSVTTANSSTSSAGNPSPNPNVNVVSNVVLDKKEISV